ncbi:ABC transporter substrate-binding protein [Cohnella xylanilytica]|uniref:extracellular solute-binding protein n=1 Tax=Cohnella xylanilytica TaxID=557555 RepID=UPI001B290193|nr:extracellular solute-binding protein [Cohnella xylanilytica]GIO15679.1 ABC transporter substrate-binding protein [Cohnella xylanilytica]
MRQAIGTGRRFGFGFRALRGVLTIVLLAGCGNSRELAALAGPLDRPSSPQAATGSAGLAGAPSESAPLSLSFLTGTALPGPYEDTLVWSEYEKKTNVRAKFDLVPFEYLEAARNLALTDGSYPDAFYAARLSARELDRYGRQGILLPLNDLIDRYAPNFKKLMERYPEIRKGLTMSDGRIYSLPSFYDPEDFPMLIGVPLWVNRDWLDRLGMDEPVTVGQWYDYLKAVKKTDLNGNGRPDEIPFSDNGIGDLINQLKGAWGLGNRGLGHPLVDVDPKTSGLRFIKTSPEYRELLEFANRLYRENLIDKEIFTLDYDALLAKGQDGLLGSTIVPNPQTLMGRSEFVGLGALEGPRGDRLYSQVKTPMAHVGAFAITDKNPDPAATMRWIDYFYGEEGATFFFMGLEGVTYEKTEDGEWRYVAEITDNPDGLTQEQVLRKYVTWMGGSYPGYVRERYFKGSETLPNFAEAAGKAKPYAVRDLWYAFNFDEAEQETMGSVGRRIETYVAEMERGFVGGSVPLSYWDRYVRNVEDMGLAEYMRAYESAYERYRKA